MLAWKVSQRRRNHYRYIGTTRCHKWGTTEARATACWYSLKSRRRFSGSLLLSGRQLSLGLDKYTGTSSKIYVITWGLSFRLSRGADSAFPLTSPIWDRRKYQARKCSFHTRTLFESKVKPHRSLPRYGSHAPAALLGDSRNTIMVPLCPCPCSQSGSLLHKTL